MVGYRNTTKNNNYDTTILRIRKTKKVIKIQCLKLVYKVQVVMNKTKDNINIADTN